MSLIIEALKKARDDALRRQAAARGLPLAPVPKLESKSRWLSLALIPLVAALVICVMLLIDVYSRFPDRADQTPDTPPPSTSETAVPAASTGAGAVTPARDDLESGADVVETAVPVIAPDSSPPENPAAEPGASPAAIIETADEVRAPRESPSTMARPEETDRIATGQGRLEGGHLVDLGGIAWSESDPYALINGQVVGVGELVRSYRVTSIRPHEVVLEKDDDRVVLRLE